jgi:hypothetical protein
MNRTWLLEHADVPINYYFNKESNSVERLMQNSEVSSWFSRLFERSSCNNIGDIHGSHDYRMENILGKCWILGLSKSIDVFSDAVAFILEFLNNHLQIVPPKELSFSKIYHYRDYEKVLSCFLPLLGFYDDPAVISITKQRINILYAFTRHKNYDIYVDGAKLKGVKKEWQPYIINPDLYADGNIALPDVHDLLLFAGMYPHISKEEQSKAETIVEWFFGEGYKNINRRYGYFYVPGGSYSTKAVIFKIQLVDFQNELFDKGDLVSLLFNVFLFSHFKYPKETEWFVSALNYLNQYKNENGRYNFPPYLITEKPDSYVVLGGHMNVGENKKSKLYNEIISTYWMERIAENIL